MTTTTDPPTTDDAIAASAAMLRARGMSVKPHGFRWLVKQTTDREQGVLTLTPDDLVLAAGLAHQAGEGVTLAALRDLLYEQTGEACPEDTIDAPPKGWGAQELPIADIRRDGGTQARVGLHEDTVQEYAEAMREGRWNYHALGKPIAYWDSQGYWLADGFHRIEAAQRAGQTTIEIEVLRGGKRAAILRAAGANAEHGLRRTNADKRRAVELLLKDEEWRGWSDREIARRCAVDHKTVGVIRAELYPGNSPDSRTVARSGTTYEMTPAARPSGVINRPDGSPALDLVPARVGRYRCGHCRQPTDSITGYGAGIIPEHPNGVSLCHPCIVELLHAKPAPTTTTAAPRRGATVHLSDGARAEVMSTAGGYVHTTAGTYAPWQVVDEKANPTQSARSFLESQRVAMRQWDNSALPTRREHEAALAHIAALLGLLAPESEDA